MKLWTINKVMTLNFTREAIMILFIFSNYLIDRNLIKFLKFNKKITIGVGRY